MEESSGRADSRMFQQMRVRQTQVTELPELVMVMELKPARMQMEMRRKGTRTKMRMRRMKRMRMKRREEVSHES
jgi:hypothetical protein